jgi:serine/threonine protein kinase
MFSPQPGLVVGQRYSLVREIGRGGMGSVWEARDLELDAPCALKFILEHIASNEDLRKRFLREARAVAQLQSPHVVSIRGVGEHEGALYTAMELLRGETLESRLVRDRVLDPLTTLKVVHQIASVLMLAHAAGITHRDLKPENIWLWEGDNTFTKLIDFGVAKHMLSTSLVQTATGSLVGTPKYMSPEQAAGSKSVDHRSDVWSLAVIAVQCLSGACPFESEGFGELFVKIIHGPIPPLRELYPEATEQLGAWWEQASQRDPNERFQSAMALAESFGAALRPSLMPRLLQSDVMSAVSLPAVVSSSGAPQTSLGADGARARSKSGTQDSLPPTELSRAAAGGERSKNGTRVASAEDAPNSQTRGALERVPMTRVGWFPVAALFTLIGVAGLWQFGVLSLGVDRGGLGPGQTDGVLDDVTDALTGGPRAGSDNTSPEAGKSPPARKRSDDPPPVRLTHTPPGSVLPGARPKPVSPATPLAPSPVPKEDHAAISQALQAEAQKTQERLGQPVISVRPKATPVNPAQPKPAAVKSSTPVKPPRPSVDGRVGF